MDGEHDVSSRWPALDIAARRDRLHDTVRVSGLLAERLTAGSHAVERLMAALWRRDPSLWSGDPATQEEIANRLGWLASPELMAGSIVRLRSEEHTSELQSQR